nr:hypothetical protein Iba_chr04aCG16470 [Ipomoea batatas]
MERMQKPVYLYDTRHRTIANCTLHSFYEGRGTHLKGLAGSTTCEGDVGESGGMTMRTSFQKGLNAGEAPLREFCSIIPCISSKKATWSGSTSCSTPSPLSGGMTIGEVTH